MKLYFQYINNNVKEKNYLEDNIIQTSWHFDCGVLKWFKEFSNFFQDSSNVMWNSVLVEVIIRTDKEVKCLQIYHQNLHFDHIKLEIEKRISLIELRIEKRISLMELEIGKKISLMKLNLFV